MSIKFNRVMVLLFGFFITPYLPIESTIAWMILWTAFFLELNFRPITKVLDYIGGYLGQDKDAFPLLILVILLIGIFYSGYLWLGIGLSVFGVFAILGRIKITSTGGNDG